MSLVSTRKQPVQSRSKVTVAIILEAAGQVLATHGIAKATTHVIAKRAGVSVGTLYQYFGNKESVFRELMRQHADRVLAAFLEHREDFLKRPLREVIPEVVHMLLGIFLENPDVSRALMEHRNQLMPSEERMRRHTLVQTMVAAGLAQRKDPLRVSDYEAAAFIILKASESLAHNAVLERPEWVQNGTLERELVQLFSRYLLEDE